MLTCPPITRRALFLQPVLSVALAFIATITCLPANAQGTEVELLNELKKGGLVVFMRHGDTGPAYADRAQAVIGDCATQRNLNETGRAQNAEMAAALKALRVPVGKVLSSDFCRSWQTAEALFGPGGYAITDKLTVPLSYPQVNKADADLNNSQLSAMLAEKPVPGRNTFLVAHGINVQLATGYHPNEQGEVVLFRPDGKGAYRRLGSILPGDWRRLSASADLGPLNK